MRAFRSNKQKFFSTLAWLFRAWKRPEKARPERADSAHTANFIPRSRAQERRKSERRRPLPGKPSDALVEPDRARPRENWTGSERTAPPRLTSLTGGNFFLHSRDRALRSPCMFSSSFLTASGLLVLDMIHQVPSQFPSGANELRHCQLPGATGNCPQPPPAPPQPASGAPRGLHGAWTAHRSEPECLRQPPRNSPGSSPRCPCSRPPR